MADRNEDFNWYPGPEFSLFLSLSAQRRLALFSSFFFFFVIVSFRLSFPYHSLALSLVPFSTKTIYRGHPGHSYLYTGERSRELLTRSPYLR